jgi:hypothetical protein
MLARALRAALVTPTLWLVGLGSPLTFDAHMVLAHAPTAGTAAVAALAAAVVVVPEAFGPRAARRWVPFTAGALACVAGAATVALRSEGILLAIGLAIGVLAAGSSWRRSIPLAAGLVATTVAVRLGELAFVRSILGQSSAARCSRWAPAPSL